MAKVTITIEDDEDNADMVNIRIESEPPWPGPAAEDQTMTAAQHMGLVALQNLNGKAKEEETFDLPQPLLVDPDAPLV